jgi:FtsZ-interacting cell division protein ZipA
MTSKIIGLFYLVKILYKGYWESARTSASKKDYSPLFAMEILFLQKVTAISLIIL